VSLRASVLVVEDDAGMVAMLESGLSRQGYDVKSVHSGDEAFELLKTEDVDVVVTDLNMRGMNGLELCERIVVNRPDVPVIVITAFGSLDTAVSAIRAGAYDFLAKPFEVTVLRIAIERAAQHRSLRDEVKRLRRSNASGSRGFEEIVGESAAMRKVYDLLDRVVESDASVLITGESGTGKEVVARALHRRSGRREGPLVAVDCAALPETLLESELFGHTSGAFTDAKAPRTGLLAQASGGTLLLDEIGEMPLGLQPKLLRALQERKIRPVGSNIEVPFDVKVVAATNQDLETAVEDGRFRQDLYYRINVIHLHLPPLRARGSDVLVLAQRFLERIAATAGNQVKRLSPEVAKRLLDYSWPGNVRELQNCLERAVALAPFEEITVEDLPEPVRNYARRPFLVDSDDPSVLLSLEELERRYILRVLEAAGQNKSLAARILRLDRKTLYRKLERYQRLTSA
jgi:two-component system response regulator HydG